MRVGADIAGLRRPFQFVPVLILRVGLRSCCAPLAGIEPTRTRPRLARSLVFRPVAEPVSSVALNGVFLAPGDSGGPETYLRELVKALDMPAPKAPQPEKRKKLFPSTDPDPA